MSRYKVRNWSQYNESLKKRGSLSLWISKDAIKKWQSPKDPHFIGAPQQYSNDAIWQAKKKAMEKISYWRVPQNA